jgi:transcriptional regulator with XRE-family HTH domain
MTAPSNLLRSPPHPVEQALKRLGENLRTARVRRKITIAAAADRIGAGPRAVMNAEKGKPSTGMAVYAALLWLYDLLQPFDDLADPAKDREGLSLELAKMPARVRKAKGLDREF